MGATRSEASAEEEFVRGAYSDALVEEQISLLLRLTSEAVWDWDLTTDYEYMSPAFWKMLGYEPAEKTHHPSEWQALLDPDQLPEVMTCFEEHVASRGKVPFDQLVRYRHKEGHWVTVRCHGLVIRWGPGGTPLRMVGTHTDFSEIIENRTRAEILYSNPNLGIFDWPDIPHGSLCFSEGFYRLVGYTRAELPASQSAFRALIHPEDWERCIAAYEAHLGAGAAFDIEYRLRCGGGEYRWFHARAESVFDPHGQPRRMVGSLRDIHEKRAAADALRARTEELSRAVQDLEDFASFASHDLQAPLRHIRSFARLLREEQNDALSPEGKSWLGQIDQAAERMAHLIEDLLIYARTGRSPGTSELLATEELLGEVAEVVNADREALEVVVDGMLPALWAPRTAFAQVLQNLLENARKYRHPDRAPKLVVSAEETQGRLTLRFRDNGVGVPEGWETRISNPFSGPRRVTRRAVESVWRCVQRPWRRLGARMRVEPTEGEGATFVVELPAWQ